MSSKKYLIFNVQNKGPKQVKRVDLRPGYSISSVIKGGWHLAGGHGPIDHKEAIDGMRAFVLAGITTFDCADIYTGVEELIGRFLTKESDAFKNGNLPPVQVHTKYVPDYDALSTLTRQDTRNIIERSLSRLGTERLDLVQFAWWDYEIPGYVETALHLAELQKEGKIRYIGATNFDAKRLDEIHDAGVDIVAHQVQYSILDHRPENDVPIGVKEGSTKLLCYGTLAGGFLSQQYLGKEDPPTPHENRSLTKYRLIIDEFGGYGSFQHALEKLDEIAKRSKVTLSSIAMKYIIQKPDVAGIIVGARNARHLAAYEELNNFVLKPKDIELLDRLDVLRLGPKGPVYYLERGKEGKHGAIMRYNLNLQRS